MLQICVLRDLCYTSLQAQKKSNAGPISEERIIRWSAHLLAALKYCHAKGVCHRDIKSGEGDLQSFSSQHCDLSVLLVHALGNIFVTEDDDVRLGDFGLARAFVGTRAVRDLLWRSR